jgi:hypothetical protein
MNMGYIVIVTLDDFHDVKFCKTEEEKNDLVKEWTDSLIETYWARDTANIRVYPASPLEEYEFEVDHTDAGYNNIFKIKTTL